MNYKYMPNSFDEKLKKEKYDDDNKFLIAQIKYKELFEKIIDSFIETDQIDLYISQKNIDIPFINDDEYNFYHKYSNLKSKYIYIRNNYHVENLSKEEIDELLYSNKLDMNFINKTLNKVIFEEGDESFFGLPTNSSLADSKSIVFEFAYNQKECKSIEQLKDIEGIIKEINQFIENKLKSKINIKISFITYKAIPDIYSIEENNIKSINL